jgi:isocitrate dehydrogenase
MGIPRAVIESVNKHKVGLKSPLMTPVGKGFRSLNLALRKGKKTKLDGNSFNDPSCPYDLCIYR